MKNALMIVLACATLSVVGCSKKTSSNPITPGNPALPATNIMFTIHLESGTEEMIFVASPNADVKLTKVEIGFPAQNFSDTVTNPNPNEVFAKNSNIHLSEYTGVNGGQQRVLKFTGTDVAMGKPFIVTVNWTVV